MERERVVERSKRRDNEVCEREKERAQWAIWGDVIKRRERSNVLVVSDSALRALEVSVPISLLFCTRGLVIKTAFSIHVCQPGLCAGSPASHVFIGKLRATQAEPECPPAPFFARRTCGGVG